MIQGMIVNITSSIYSYMILSPPKSKQASVCTKQEASSLRRLTRKRRRYHHTEQKSQLLPGEGGRGPRSILCFDLVEISPISVGKREATSFGSVPYKNKDPDKKPAGNLAGNLDAERL